MVQPLFSFAASLKLVTHSVCLDDDEKLRWLNCLELVLFGEDPPLPQEDSPPSQKESVFSPANPLFPDAFLAPARSIFLLNRQSQMDIQWAQRLLQAARRDVSRPTCNTWSDVMLYCRYAAEPLGRAILEAYAIRNAPEIERATDSLTAALLVHALMRRAREDWIHHGRCFLPLEWIREAGGTPEQLVEGALSPALRSVCNTVLGRTRELVMQARSLPVLLERTPSLKAETMRLLFHADYQNKQLRRCDPLSRRLKTPMWVRGAAHLGGWLTSRS